MCLDNKPIILDNLPDIEHIVPEEDGIIIDEINVGSSFRGVIKTEWAGWPVGTILLMQKQENSSFNIIGIFIGRNGLPKKGPFLEGLKAKYPTCYSDK